MQMKPYNSNRKSYLAVMEMDFRDHLEELTYQVGLRTTMKKIVLIIVAMMILAMMMGMKVIFPLQSKKEMA